MAEKEERAKDLIYVFSQELICKNCQDWYEHIDPLDKQDCDNCEDIADLPHISRQEAIERMAKALCEKDFGDCGKCMCRNDDECYTVVEDSKWFGLAEAALNALLEGK